MKQTKEILKHLESRYSDIDYYHVVIEKIEKNVHNNPDVSIEACKSLIEGISKFILKHLDNNYDSRSIDQLEFSPLFKKSLLQMSAYTDLLEEDFVLRSGSLIHLIGEIRNRRGDISHGKLSPKEVSSDTLFSNLVMQMSDGLIRYILECFSKIEIQQELQYEDNPEFNAWFDDINQFGNLSYSRALFDQDIVAYKQELLDFIDEQENKK